MKETKLGTYIRNDETYNFNFVTDLSASEKITFVDSIVDTIVGENYNSMIRDIMFNHMIIQLFTDVGDSYFKDSENKIDVIEQFVEETNIVEIVRANIKVGLFEELTHSLDLAIEYRTGIHPSPIADSLANLINTFEKKINKIDLGNAMKMAQKFAGMTGKLTPESVVNAYIDSDFHQKNLDEIAERKKEKVEIAENLDKAIKIVKAEEKKKSKTKIEK